MGSFYFMRKLDFEPTLDYQAMDMQSSDEIPGCCEDWKKKVSELQNETEIRVKEEPLKSVGMAFIIGFFFSLFPVGKVIKGILRFTLFFAKPALLIFGLVKFLEEVDTKKIRS